MCRRICCMEMRGKKPKRCVWHFPIQPIHENLDYEVPSECLLVPSFIGVWNKPGVIISCDAVFSSGSSWAEPRCWSFHQVVAAHQDWLLGTTSCKWQYEHPPLSSGAVQIPAAASAARLASRLANCSLGFSRERKKTHVLPNPPSQNDWGWKGP